MTTNTQEATFTEQEQVYFDRLARLRDQLLNDFACISDVSLHNTKQAGEEFADIGSDNFQREMGLALMSEEGIKLQMIDAAIRRLHKGTYGVCVDSGKKISEKRLEAIPYATRTIEAQEEYEKNVAKGLIQADNFHN